MLRGAWESMAGVWRGSVVGQLRAAAAGVVREDFLQAVGQEPGLREERLVRPPLEQRHREGMRYEDPAWESCGPGREGEVAIPTPPEHARPWGRAP